MMIKRNINKYGIIFSFFFLGMAAPSAQASNYAGYVSNVTAYNGKIYVALAAGAEPAGANPCSGIAFIFDPTTVSGKSYLAIVLTAKISGKRVYIWGDDSCSWTPYGTNTSQVMTGIDLNS
jgi:hypothetical protein